MISIIHTKTKPVEEVKNAFLKLMAQLNYTPSKTKVLLKPNIVDAVKPQTAVITDPKVIGGLILALKDKGVEEFVIGENSGFFSINQKNFQRLIKETGYRKMVDRLKKKHGINVRILNLQFTEFDEYPWIYGTLKLPKICRTHSYINIAKMKTHQMTAVTLSMKNQKGLLLFQDKKNFHLGYDGAGSLHSCIREYAKVIQPEFSIIDSTCALEGTGPVTGPENQTKVRHLNILIAGKDMIELDNAACQIMGVSIEDVQHLPKKKVNLAPGSEPIIPADPPFQKPDSYMKYGNIFLHTSPYGCSNCQMAFSRMFRKIMFTPEYIKKFQNLQQKYPRIDVFIGNTSITEIPNFENPVVFFGKCTKSIAEDLRKNFIPGCPPNHNKAIDVLFNL
ncbi:DUF362 domain-containing protein [Promethearchaeum syntrophicum]|uniref:DUF362 domain-containing protein n=1 Tax=Promethearchaeum syntrophicum TaxID=2594042 RepID=A0A5B9D9P8_9ARCH|nr:DUF362 domain-containing protein [Candidatus Prometheoarchaeum syntrophicum]QEE15460.1 hypothetical protein DSAG12_01286 [Candidatus Prometheoarchaeum syntrophicum]